MRKIAFILASVFMLQSCMTSSFRGASTGMWAGATMGSAIGGLVGGHRGHHLGTVIGVIAGAAAGTVAANAAEKRRYDEYVDSYNNSSRRSNSQARQVPSSSYRDDTSVETGRQTYSPITLRNLRFIDSGGDQVINRGEECQIIFELSNSTSETLYDVVPYVYEANGNSHVQLSPSVRIEVLKPGDVVRYTCAVLADKKLSAGELMFRISVSYADNDFVTLREFTLPSAK